MSANKTSTEQWKAHAMSPVEDAGELVARPLPPSACAARPPRRMAVGDKREEGEEVGEELEEDEDE